MQGTLGKGEDLPLLPTGPGECWWAGVAIGRGHGGSGAWAGEFLGWGVWVGGWDTCAGLGKAGEGLGCVPQSGVGGRGDSVP